jgi:glycosyltransferase involved in cell wall biosynthesis
MKVSVIIPALNEEQVIGTCLAAVQHQAPDAELLVVDGGSTDATVSIAEKHGARVVLESTPTVAAGRNTGLEKATSDIALFIDADCVPMKHWFEQMIAPFSNPLVLGVGGRAIPLDGTFIEHLGLRLVFNIAAPIFFAFQTPLITGQIMAFRRKEAIAAGGFDPKQIHGEDTSMFLAVKKQGLIVHSPATVQVSMRRIRKWGLLKYLSFNLRNFISLLRFEKPIEDAYEAVRE